MQTVRETKTKRQREMIQETGRRMDSRPASGGSGSRVHFAHTAGCRGRHGTQTAIYWKDRAEKQAEKQVISVFPKVFH